MITSLTIGCPWTVLQCIEQTNRKKQEKKGGGLCVYLNKHWCSPNNMSVRYTECTPAAEILTVSAHPYYLPPKFSHVIIMTVYVPPSVCAREAADCIASHVHDVETRAPDAVKIITGDFNHCDLQKLLPGYQQQIECTTRGQHKLDLFFCSVKDAYTSMPLPLLGHSDHNLVNLMPKYRPLVQRVPPETKLVQDWSPVGWESLKGCFECTDWSVFIDTATDVSELADTVCSYINFCVKSVILRKSVKIFSNNKPWVTKHVKEMLNRKKQAFQDKDKDQLTSLHKELRRVLRRVRRNTKEKLSQSLKKTT